MKLEIYPVGVGNVNYTAVVKVKRKGLTEIAVTTKLYKDRGKPKQERVFTYRETFPAEKFVRKAAEEYQSMRREVGHEQSANRNPG